MNTEQREIKGKNLNGSRKKKKKTQKTLSFIKTKQTVLGTSRYWGSSFRWNLWDATVARSRRKPCLDPQSQGSKQGPRKPL